MFHPTRLIKIIFWVSLFPLGLALTPIKLLPEDNGDWLWSRITVLNRPDFTVNTLIAGPSFIMEGIHPSVFDTTAQARGEDLHSAKISAGALSLAELDYLLRQLNESALSKLKLVIIDVSFRAWDRLPDNRFTQRSIYWSDWSALKLTAQFTDWHRWDSQWGLKTFWSRFQHTVVRSLKIGAGRELVAQWFTPRTVRPLSVLEYQPKERSASTRAKDIAGEILALRGQWNRPRQSLAQCRESLSRAERAVFGYLEKVTARFAKRDTKVLFVVSPHTSPWLCFLSDEIDPALPIVLFNNPDRYPEMYKVAERRNASHLNSVGAVAYSHELARVAADFLAQKPKLAAK